MKFTKPLIFFLAFFASIHVIILLILTLFTGEIEFLNVFYILGLNYFIPDISKGILSQIASFLIIIIVFVFFYTRTKK